LNNISSSFIFFFFKFLSIIKLWLKISTFVKKRKKKCRSAFLWKSFSIMCIFAYVKKFNGLIHVYLHISDFRFIPCKKNCLDFNPVISRFFGFRPSWHHITTFKVLSTPVIWENFCLPHIISSILYSQSSWRSKTK